MKVPGRAVRDVGKFVAVYVRRNRLIFQNISFEALSRFRMIAVLPIVLSLEVTF